MQREKVRLPLRRGKGKTGVQLGDYFAGRRLNISAATAAITMMITTTIAPIVSKLFPELVVVDEAVVTIVVVD